MGQEHAAEFAGKVDRVCSGDMPLDLNGLQKEAERLNIKCCIATQDVPLRIYVSGEMYDGQPDMGTYSMEKTGKIEKNDVFLMGEGAAVLNREEEAGGLLSIGEVVGGSVKALGWQEFSREISLSEYLNIRLNQKAKEVERAILSTEKLDLAESFDKVYSLYKENQNDIAAFLYGKRREYYSVADLFDVMGTAAEMYIDCPAPLRTISFLLSEEVEQYCVDRMENGDFRTATELRQSNVEKLEQLQRIYSMSGTLQQQGGAYNIGTTSYFDLKGREADQGRALAFMKVPIKDFVQKKENLAGYKVSAFVKGGVVNIACAQADRQEIQGLFFVEKMEKEQGVQLEPRKGR